ncbi:autophagy-related protein 2 [Diplogelasinospora grovesii]|uniref:Autophagy-related protein 2 n=1 Tax=Diplogelasinospora grovesii TaxID=303347 RepID=A0AAN6NAN8_9PEZI|nr:autophagy-related protein 2 [Diplogelasinospora grovesii]
MASFFQSFRSSLMPKQLLRFALSRLELLDEQALDLENLDFALGRNTVLEFRDVGLVLQKLEALLQLPPTFSLQKAKVLVLRVTIPMDFYTSPIIAEVDGVDVRLSVTSREAKEQQQARKRRADKDDAEVVPSAADLAQSFLETQPSLQKKELEEALAAESHDLGASMALSDADSDTDEALAYGTGQTLSLPAFLTGFLQGIVDRMQIRVQSLRFQVDMEVPVDPSAPAPELVTLQLAMDGINVEGVTAPSHGADGGPAIVHKEGKRHILLDNIRAFLISEANVFSTLSRSSSMTSPVADTESPAMAEPPAFMHQAPQTTLAMSMSSDPPEDEDELAQSHYALRDSEDAFNIPYDFSENADGADDEGESPGSTPRASVYQDSEPAALEDYAQSAVVEPEPAPWATFERAAQSEPHLKRPESVPLPLTPPPVLSRNSSASASVSSAAGSGIEDLTQSHLYTHEEAESMYMSAFSQAHSVAQSTGLRTAMPGSWDTESYPTGQSPPPPPQKTTPPRDPGASPSPTQRVPVEESQQPGNPGKASPSPRPTADRPRTPIDPYPAASNESESADTWRSENQPRESEPQQDDIPTPRGPTRLVKEIMSLQSISVYLPSNHTHIQVSAPGLDKSIHPNLPGAFSIHSAAPTSPGLPPVATEPTEKPPPDNSIEIILKPMEVRFDASIGFILAMIVSKLLDAVKSESGDAPPSATPSKQTPSPKNPDVRLTLEELSVHFLEKLAGVADTPWRFFETKAADFSPDVLLKANIVDLKASLSTSGSQTEANLSIEKFRFGYVNDDIISFDRQIQMWESVANTFPSAGREIAVKVVTSSDNTRCQVDTLPLHVKVDLQRLDETFSWFGGLSSFLNMASSTVSNAPKSAKSPVKPRGVRFEAPIRPEDKTAAKENKVDLRINGLRVDLIGRECSVALNTSALKLVSREEGLGIHFSKIQLSGPYLRNSGADAPVFIDITGTRLEYVTVPRHDDLERLLELITPSKVKFDENEDEIMVDTLLRQRKKGAVLCLAVNKINVDAGNLQQLKCLPSLVEDLARLGTVAKYLPEDDRPGLLTLGHVKELDCTVEFGGRFGAIQASLTDLELAHITVPSLVAIAVSTVSVNRNKIEELVGTSATTAFGGSSKKPPVLMMRMIDDIEPVLKVKLMGLIVEYRVPTIMDVLGLADDATPQDFEASLAASVANLGDQAHTAMKGASTPSASSSEQSTASKPVKIDLGLRDCLIGLNPLGLPSKMVLVLTDAHLEATPGKRNTVNALTTLKKASVLLIDDSSMLDSSAVDTTSRRRSSSISSSHQVRALCERGYVNICQISAAKASVKVTKDDEGQQHLEIEVRDDLLVLETCADSTQTLIALANALTPPTPPSKEIKYRTSVVPVQDLLASITADAFGKAEGDYDFDNDFAMAQELGGDSMGDSEDDLLSGGVGSPLQLDSHYYEEAAKEQLFDATSSSILAGGPRVEETSDGILLSTTSFSAETSNDALQIEDNYFQPPTTIRGTAHRWNSKRNTYDTANDVKLQQSPLRVYVRDVHVIWHLFDGYDWARTRDVISKAVHEVEAKAQERRARISRRNDFEDSEEDETVIGDFLFNSIYIGIPANRDPRELAHAINQELNDNATETESVATTNVTTATARAAGHHRPSPKKLKLNRGRRHKITFELKGVNVDLVTFPPEVSETLSSIDVRIHDIDVFDHVPTSTWKKFAMYDHDAGERELGAHMVHLELLNTRPVPSMPASEIVLKVTVLPLRLHVDQDALDFIIRFFEFKDDSVPVHSSPTDVPFIQRAEINDIPVRLDFKPKRVDYAGLRSGRTSEFMNFLILEDARMVLRHIILYGVSGFDRLGKQLNDLWTANVTGTQLPGVLTGLAAVRPLVNAGSGFRELIEIPIREYRKDGRIVRSIGKGAAAFAKTTGTEVVKLGAKLAIGTQYALQSAEGMLVSNPHGEGSSSAAAAGGSDEWSEDDFVPEEKKQISLYADQPLGIIQGVRGAYASLARDLSMARDAIIAVPAEVMESSSAQGAAKAVLKRAPTIIFRPAIGATKAIGQTLLGATNSLDPQNRRRVEAKYKRH